MSMWKDLLEKRSSKGDTHDAQVDQLGAQVSALDRTLGSVAKTGILWLPRQEAGHTPVSVDDTGRAAVYSTRVRTLWLHPADFIAMNGTPTLGAIGGWPTGLRVWGLPDAANSGITVHTKIPADWSSGTVKFTIYHQRGGAGAFHYRLTLQMSAITPGTDGFLKGVDTTLAETVAEAPVCTAHTFATGLTIDAGDIMRFSFGRAGADGTDSSTDVMYLVGVQLEYTAHF